MGYNSGVPPEHSGYGPMGGPDTGPSSPYPTYYNLDQNRMCTPPDPGPPYGVANFAATGCYRAMPPNVENMGMRNERTGSSMPMPPAGVYPPPMVNGVSDGDFGTGAPPPPLGAPPRSSDFDRPYAGQQAATPPCDDPMKRRRSSDSALCGRPSSVGPAGPAKVTSPAGAADGACKLRRRSVAVVPDGSSAVGPRAPSEPPPGQRVKTEPVPSGSEPDPASASDAASSANTSSSAAPGASPLLSPPKKKRGRPFGAKNKAKDSATTAGKRKRSKVAAVATPPAAAMHVVAAAGAVAKARASTTGPYIRVVGTRERPQSSQIVNVAPRTVPEDESKRKKVSAPARVGPPHHSTGRRVAGSAAHTSTLSPHYDAVTRDPTWLCAFCHRGSHHQGLGDLYGPYPGAQQPPRPADPDLNNSSGSSSLEEMLRKGRATKRKKSDSFSGSEDGPTSRRVSRQRKTSEAEREPELPKEIWVHETCAVWTQGVYLGGNRVHGLQEAIAEAANLVCSKCKMAGASVGCISRACSEKYHFLCAVEKGCQLNTENFSILCFKHKKANARPS